MVTDKGLHLDQPVQEEALDTQGFESPRNLMECVEEDLAPLLKLADRPVISAKQYNRQQLIQLCRLAARYETEPHRSTRPLTGKILISAFYEPSTRTRLSFESAWHRLGGDVMSITDPATTGIAKGESVFDVAEMMTHYGDLVVLRDNDRNVVYEMLEGLRIPIVNGGNGTDEHPTQAMADIYAMLKAFPQLLDEVVPDEEKISVGIIGVPDRMRTVRSLLYLLRNFSGGIKEVIIVSDKDNPFSEGQREELEAAGLNIKLCKSLNPILPSLDVVYINAIAWVDKDVESHGKAYVLSDQSPLKATAIVLHPLARGKELDRSLDITPHNWYFAQARGAVYIRMALLSAILKSYS